MGFPPKKQFDNNSDGTAVPPAAMRSSTFSNKSKCLDTIPSADTSLPVKQANNGYQVFSTGSISDRLNFGKHDPAATRSSIGDKSSSLLLPPSPSSNGIKDDASARSATLDGECLDLLFAHFAPTGKASCSSSADCYPSSVSASSIMSYLSMEPLHLDDLSRTSSLVVEQIRVHNDDAVSNIDQSDNQTVARILLTPNFRIAKLVVELSNRKRI